MKDGLALVFGDGKPGAGARGDTEPPPDFEDAAVRAFPELDGKPKRIRALYEAIRACESAGDGESDADEE